MVTTDVELQISQQLKEAGKRLSHPPASVDRLLHILDQTEKVLSKVDQSPSTLILEAFRQSTKALVHRRFLNHSNIDVKVAVAACLCEITRITAPVAPFNDKQMKGVFQLIVSSFENLSDKSSRSYIKRVSILDTVSKVRSCVIMLDLELEDLIVEMFEHFLKPVRDHHEDMLLSMVNIISLVLEESEDISLNILKPLLDSIKNNTEGALPVVRKLGERVLKRCAATLKPFLIETLRISGDSLDNYSQVLASICEGTTDVDHNDETTVVQQQADESKLTLASSDNTARVVIGNAESDATFDATLKSLRNNVRRVSVNEGGSADKVSSKKPEEAINHPDPDPTSKLDTNESVAEKLAKVDSKPDQTSKRQGNKTDTTRKSATPSDFTHGHDEIKIDEDTDVPKAIESEVSDAPSESGNLPDEKYVKKKSRTKRAGWVKKKSIGQDNAPSTEGISDSDMKSPKRARKKATFAREDKIPAVIVTVKDSKATSDSDSKHLKTSSKKVDTIDPGSKQENRSGKKVGGVDSLAKKPKLSGEKTDTGDSEANKSKKESTKDYESDSDAKLLKDFTVIKDKRRVITKPSEHTANREDGSDSDTRPHQPSSKKGDRSSSAPVKSSTKKKKGKRIKNNGKNVEEKDQTKSLPEDDSVEKTAIEESNLEQTLSSSKKSKGKKINNSKNVEEKDQTKSLPKDDGMDVPPKSAEKTATEESNLEETPVTTSKRKRAVRKDNVTIKYDDSLVGRKVKVWWPLDKKYYEGVIKSFDKNKHKVLYLDGEEEMLDLKKERWDFLQEFFCHNEDIPAEVTRGDETPKKNSKTSQDKPKGSAKRAAGASRSSKSKGPTSKSSTSSKGKKGKAGIKSTFQKNSSKSVKANSKEAGVSVEDDVQLSELVPNKQETLKIFYKSKGKTAESGNIEDANESINLKSPKSISTDVKESEDADAAEDAASPKGKPAEKTTKIGSKRGKKRKKST